MKNIYRILVITLLFFAAGQVHAQQISVGGGLWYGSDISSLGISANARYQFNDKWSAAPSFTYFLEKDYVKWSTLDFDANYALTEIENLGSLYAIGGIGITFWSINIDGSDFGMDDYGFDEMFSLDASGSDFGLNLGVGLNIEASEKFGIAPELKYTISDGGYFRVGAKILFGL